MTDLNDSIRVAMAGAAPQLDPAEANTVTLMLGVHFNGEWHRHAKLRELTGADEEAIQKDVSRKKPQDQHMNDYVMSALKLAVVSLGSLTLDSPATKELLEHLIVGDRDLLMLGVLRNTYGNSREFTIGCPHCDAENTVEIALDDTEFPIEGWDNRPEMLAEAVRKIDLRCGTVTVQYPTSFVLRQMEKMTSNAEQNSVMIAECCKTGDTDSSAERLEWARNLSLPDRRKLVLALNKEQPGPRIEEVKVACGQCSKDVLVPLDWASLLLG